IDDLSAGNMNAFVHPASKVLYSDLRNIGMTKQAIEECQPEIVFHLAANAAENKAQFSPIDITSRNYDAFIKMLVPAINNKVRRIVFTSSIAVYGDLNKKPYKEKHDPHPEDLYGVSKLAIEQTLRIMSDIHGFEYTIVRPHNVYGPRQNANDPYRNVVTIFMNRAMIGKPVDIYGDGEQRRCFSYIDEVADAIVEAGFAETNGMTLNVGADKDYSVNELVEAIETASGKRIKRNYLKDRPGEVKVATADHRLAKKHLNYKDKTTLDDGIKKTWDWISSLGPQVPNITPFEIPSDKTPENWK
ncbi:MAG: NAD-dependent epimerase/dehydratase family protein, partial [Candidatus Riesia sp.]|nr:NAD-dependent epimerase/dehydratase family protein [Candidatus Riesia sp.]